MHTRKWGIVVGAMLLTGCMTQSPAPVVSGYNRMPWEPKKRVISAAPVKQIAPAQLASVSAVTPKIENLNMVAQNKPQQQIAMVQKPKQSYSLTRSRFDSNAQQQQTVSTMANLPTVEELNAIQPAAGSSSGKIKQSVVSYLAHKVKRGETLYRIGKNYNVSVIDLMSVNDFVKPQDLIAETIIRIPVNRAVTKNKPALSGRISSGIALSKGMVWPVRGSILQSYGHKGNGINNTGIKIAVPENTPVAAAEGGKVIYADSGLKSYGNLVLLRHKGGLVTAYAHNNQLSVKKNEVVKKGQVIALSGSTGMVTTPQLHFEVRRNAQAINPLSVLPQ